MKVGDVVYSLKVRPEVPASIIKADVTIKERNNKKEVRTKYVAKYNDGAELTFYGFNINKTVFKFKEPNGQMTLFDFM